MTHSAMASAYRRCNYGGCREEEFVRGLCKQHYRKCYEDGSLDTWGLPATAPVAGPGRSRKDLTGLRVGYMVVDSRDGDQWKCICTICGSIVLRTHKKLTQSINCNAKSYCGECLGPQVQGSRKAAEKVRVQKTDQLLKNRNHAILTTIKDYQIGARKRNIAWELSAAEVEFFIFQPCHYCGLEGDKTKGGVVYNGIDRVDSSRHYEAANCVPCCGICNRAKGTLSVEAWQKWLERFKPAA